MITYRQAYQTGQKLLNGQTEAPAFDAGQLFFAFLGKRRHELPLCGEEPAAGEAVSRFLLACRQRAEGVPLQYLLGTWEFYGLPFELGPGVLIPRPDTEVLVESALELLRERDQPAVLDMCSGSGCIGVSIARHCREARVTAVELSGEAFVYLKKNIRINRVSIEAVREDARAYTPPRPLFLIVSNPPYIPRKDLPFLQREVRREPAMALDGGADGLDFYRLLASRYIQHLLPGGYLLVEVGRGQAEAVTELFRRGGLADVSRRRDYSGIDRVVWGQKPPAV